MRIYRILSALWQGIREWSGDAAYETYRRSWHRCAANRPMLTEREFYVEQLNRRYSRPNRCC